AGALAITNFVFALSCLYAGPYLDRESAGGHIPARWARHYWSLIHVFFGAMVWTCLADSLGMVWVSMELTTLVTVPLVCLSGDKRGLEAAWKYFILCSVGIAFALVGTVLLYASTLKIAAAGGHSLSWSVIVAHASRLDPVLVRLAFLFALVGYGCKMGLAPLHNWLPDAHSEAPTPVSALLSGVLLNCAGYAVIRFTSVATRCLGADAVSPTLVALGLASVMVAAFFVVVQKDLKRLLAYSSVEHMGIIVIGLALGPAGIYAALFHALNHSVAKALLFLGAGQVVLGYRTQQMVRIHGLVDTARPTALALGAGGLAIVGLPPFAPFLSELLLLRAAFMGGHPVIGTLLLLALTLTFAGFLGHLVPMLCGARPPKVEPYEETRWAVPVSALLVLVSVCLCVSVPVGLDRFLASCVMTITGGQR
ncbi:MAG: hydrogenase 4 subunit F, partial [Candidatus Riflebacteria bacterium]|nr:hydrogenase 4 subunit F [Candidatus Riflebacteria bacterium]